MSKSTPAKPPKPYAGFPLFPHASGRWAKKHAGKLYYVLKGRWANVKDGKLVPVEDTDAAAAIALEEFNRVWPYWSTGRVPPAEGETTGYRLDELCNDFLNAKRAMVDSRELAVSTFNQYCLAVQRLVDFFGKEKQVASLSPDDFEKFRAHLAQGQKITTLRLRIVLTRVILKYASDTRKIDRPVDYGRSFDRPTSKAMRKAKHEAGEKMFSPAEIRKLLRAAEGNMRAMILLGINCGFGNNDISSLPRAAVDLKAGWISFPRPKTAVMRRIPLWPETIAALKAALAEPQAKPQSPEDVGLCFLTNQGARYVRIMDRGGMRFVPVDQISKRFHKLLRSAKLPTRRGVNFYTLRHCFETIGGESRDQVAVDAIMGHVDPSMGAQYRQWISDDRLKAVTETVRTWLFAKQQRPA